MKQSQFNALNILLNVVPGTTFDFIEKGKKAEIGSIHTWSDGADYRKTVDGWIKISEAKFKDYILNLKLTTEDQFCKNGQWDKQRVENFHKPIIEKSLNKITKTSKEPVVTLMMGASASGKGLVLRYLKENDEEHKGLPDVNPDHIKTEDLSQDYKAYQKYNIRNAAHKVHEEGSYLSKQVIKEYDKLGAHYIQDKCFDNYDKLIGEINRLGSLGVKVKVMMVYLPVDIAYERMIERGKNTGRYVIKREFYKKHKRVNVTFERLLKDIPKNVIFIRKYSTEGKVKLLKQFENETAQ